MKLSSKTLPRKSSSEVILGPVIPPHPPLVGVCLPGMKSITIGVVAGFAIPAKDAFSSSISLKMGNIFGRTARSSSVCMKRQRLVDSLDRFARQDVHCDCCVERVETFGSTSRGASLTLTSGMLFAPFEETQKQKRAKMPLSSRDAHYHFSFFRLNMHR